MLKKDAAWVWLWFGYAERLKCGTAGIKCLERSEPGRCPPLPPLTCSLFSFFSAFIEIIEIKECLNLIAVSHADAILLTLDQWTIVISPTSLLHEKIPYKHLLIVGASAVLVAPL